MSMHGPGQIILLLGGPGAGKGTQARFLGEVLGVPHVASGDLLREHRRRGTALGRAAEAYMDRGDLVPDELVIDMIMERLERADARRGALLDGFPRTRAQAEVLDHRLGLRGEAVRAALYLDVPKDVLVARLAGRWLCGTCQASYPGSSTVPPTDGACAACGDRLYQRPDDRPEVVEKRIEVYLRETLPVIDYYAARGLLRRIDGARPIEDVRAALCIALGGVVRGRRRNRWHLFVNRLSGTGARTVRWLGRTLCGKYVERFPARETGSEEAFRANPCRRCRRALRARQGPRLAPSPSRPALTAAGE
jgi:adenylate kinase